MFPLESEASFGCGSGPWGDLQPSAPRRGPVGWTAEGPLEGRRYHHGAVRDAVLAGALELLADQGPDALTLRLLARRAGVSHTAVGKEFGGFPSVLAACAVAIYARLEAAQVEASGGVTDPLDAFRAMGRAYIAFAARHPGWMQFLGHPALGSVRDDPALATAARGPYQAVLGAIRRCHEAGAVREAPPEDLALLAWTAVHGFAMFFASGGALPAPHPAGGDAAELLLDQLYLGLRPLDAPPRTKEEGDCEA
jgi:AcrR family transcriptional regulator